MTTTDEKIHTVHAEDLPLACPPDNEPLWARHPRVFLKPDAQGRATCPYCGSRFQVEGEIPHGH